MTIKPEYIIADHIRASCFIIASGVKPSGKQKGYVLRRLIRRSLVASSKLNIDVTNIEYIKELVEQVKNIYLGVYPEITDNKELIIETIYTEAKKYQQAVNTGQKEWAKYLKTHDDKNILEVSHKIWDLYQTYGVPIELSEDILETSKVKYDKNSLNTLITEHQDLSKSSSKGQFKSGLGSHTDKTKKLHTVTHILHAILRQKYGENIRQMGSAITDEKARFDFTMNEKLTDDQLQDLENTIQNWIDKNLNMTFVTTTPEKAKESGAIGLFGEKYGDSVTVYSLVDESGKTYSREFCTGPHVDNTSEIGQFKILKHKSIGQGLKRLEYDIS